jgi:pyruvate dehydrogenase E2 component (dihydrolipoamide acetyltransferase)
LVFLHGLGGSQSTWQVVLGDLVSSHRTAAFDLPGHGASDKSAGADYSIDGITAAVQEAIGKLGMERPILIGHSLGGAVALRLAAQSPELLTGGIVINSAGLGSEISSELTALMTGSAGIATARELLQLFYEDQRLVNDRGVQEMAQSQLGEGAWPAQQAVSSAAFSGGRQLESVLVDISTIRIPVAIIWGERDRVLPLQHAVEVLGRFADANLTVVPGVGHVPQVESPRRTAELIERFARSLAAE